MNFFIYKLSRKCRFRLALCFTIINIIQICLGLLMTVWSIYICLSVSKHLYSEKAEITFVFTVTGMYGTHVIFQYLMGFKICEQCFVKAHKKSTKRYLCFWLAIGCNTILNISILACMAVKISKHIVRSIRHSMEKGMRSYLRDPIWKHTIDRWQFNLQCCGINDYKDWYEISWLDKYHIDVQNPLVERFLLSKDHLHLPVVPWSCCDVNFPMQCFHDPLQQIQFAHLWKEQPEFLDGTITQKGCLEMLRQPIEASLIGLMLVAFILIINQIAIIIISRFLYTSCRNAVVLRDIKASSPGWLFGRDCFSAVKGRTVSEVMLSLDKKNKKNEDASPAVQPRVSSLETKTKYDSARPSARDPISSDDEDALMLK